MPTRLLRCLPCSQHHLQGMGAAHVTTSVANNIGVNPSNLFSSLNGAIGYNGGSNAMLSINDTKFVQLGRCSPLGGVLPCLHAIASRWLPKLLLC